MLDLRRRDFITLLGGVAPSWPLAAGAQQADRVRRIGVLMPLAADDREAPARIAAFHQGLQQLGWNVGRNVRIEYRWGAGDPERIRKSITELIDLAPDVIWPVAARRWHHCCRRLARCRSFSCCRSGRRRLCRQLGAARRQCHRFCHLRIHQWKMAGAAQAGSASRDAAGSFGITLRRGTVTVGRNPGHGAIGRSGGGPSQRARRARDRTRRHGIRALSKWRSTRDSERTGSAPP